MFAYVQWKKWKNNGKKKDIMITLSASVVGYLCGCRLLGISVKYPEITIDVLE